MNDAANESATLQAEAEAATARAHRLTVRRKWLVRLGIAVLATALAVALWYFLFGRNYVSTDNAYVNAESAQVTPLVQGPVKQVLVRDTQMVKSGQVLVEIDPTIATLFVARAEAELAEAERNYRRTVANNSALSAQVLSRGSEIAEAEAKLAAARADLAKSGADLRRNQQLSQEGIVSAEQLDASRKALAAAQAAVAAGQAAIAQARSRRSEAQGEYAANDALVRGSSEDTDPAVRAARAKLEHARLDLASTTLRAPIDGVVTRRQVQLGQHVMPGQVLMTIVPVGQAFVDANFKERQLDRVRVGMPAKVTVDLYGGDVVFNGKVAGIAGGTGASMSMIPAQNATGNWIKVVQRLPVRIELDPKELAAHPLRVGLSAEVEIDVSGK